MRRNPAEARQLLTKLLKGRLVFEPKEDAEGRYYEFSGEGALTTLVGASISPEVVVTPAGFARISAVKVRGILPSPPSFADLRISVIVISPIGAS